MVTPEFLLFFGGRRGNRLPFLTAALLDSFGSRFKVESLDLSRWLFSYIPRQKHPLPFLFGPAFVLVPSSLLEQGLSFRSFFK